MASEPEYELEMSRIFDAPRERVYRAFVDADQLAHWFGPVGYTVPRATVDIDAHVGGHQRFVMLSNEDPTFRDHVNATFSEVIENERLVGTQEVIDLPGWEGITNFTLRLEFYEEPGGKTRLELRQGPYTEQMEGMARTGWESSFGKLDTLLEAS